MKSASSRWPRRLAFLYVGLVAAFAALYWLGPTSPGTWAVTLVLPWSMAAILIGFAFAPPIGGVVAIALFLGGVGINAWVVYALTRYLIRR